MSGNIVQSRMVAYLDFDDCLVIVIRSNAIMRVYIIESARDYEGIREIGVLCACVTERRAFLIELFSKLTWGY